MAKTASFLSVFCTALPCLLCFVVCNDYPRLSTINASSRTDTSNSNSDQDLLVTITSGILRGTRFRLGNGAVLKEFKGIPFARPPTGNIRFRRPEPPQRWTGIRDASVYGNRCPQPPGGILVDNTGMGEDCLYLNVFSPVLDNQTQALLPVMMWIHGGAYIGGSGSDFNATILASKGVVVVTINYRLDAFGFLSTEDDIMPGNYGMLDQLMALRWIQLNIQAFGGDPNSVTIFGQSAGGHSVGLLAVSPLASGLFHRAIFQSGSAIAPSSIKNPVDNVQHRQFAKLLSSKVGCNVDDPAELLLCLQSRSAEDIFNASRAIQDGAGLFMTLKPRVENTFGFLPDYPYNLLVQGQFARINTLHGYTDNELGNFIPDPENDGVTEEEFTAAVINKISGYNYKAKDAIVQTLVDILLQNISSPIERRSKLAEVLSDFEITSAMIHEADFYARSSDVSQPDSNKHFLYRLSYRASYQSQTPQWWGVPHALDVPLVTGLAVDTSARLTGNAIPDAEDLNVADDFVTMWTNFAKYGNPTPRPVDGAVWQPYTQSNLLFLDILATPILSVLDRTDADLVFRIINQQLFGLYGSSVVG